MKLGKVSFTKEGFDSFQKLTRKKQIEKLNKLMPLDPNVERLLKGVKYGNDKASATKVSESKEPTTTSKPSSKRNTKRSKSKESKD